MTDKKTKDVENIWTKYENNLKLLDETLDKLDSQKAKIKELEKKNKELSTELNKLREKKYDYWGKPKNSKRKIDDTSYEQATYQRYQRLLKEVQLGRIDINSLQQAEQNIIRQLMNE